MTTSEQHEHPDPDQGGERSVRQLDHPRSGTVVDLLARTVAERPRDHALVDAERTFTYEALEVVVTTAARGLVALGVRPGDRVAVALTDTADAVVLVLAALRAGAVAVPVDVEYPDSRIAEILLDARAHLLVADDERSSQLLGLLADSDTPGPDRTWRVCCADDVVGAGAADLPAPPSPDDVAYLVCTSASTGTPSGVEVRHAALVAVLAHHEELVAETSRSAGSGQGHRAPMLRVSGVGFDSAWDPILWLVAGTTLHAVDGRHRADPEPAGRSDEVRR